MAMLPICVAPPTAWDYLSVIPRWDAPHSLGMIGPRLPYRSRRRPASWQTLDPSCWEQASVFRTNPLCLGRGGLGKGEHLDIESRWWRMLQPQRRRRDACQGVCGCKGILLGQTGGLQLHRRASLSAEPKARIASSACTGSRLARLAIMAGSSRHVEYVLSMLYGRQPST